VAVALPAAGPGSTRLALVARGRPPARAPVKPGDPARGCSGLAGPVGGVGVGRGQQAGAVRQPAGVVPVDSRGGDLSTFAAVLAFRWRLFPHTLHRVNGQLVQSLAIRGLGRVGTRAGVYELVAIRRASA
jgi:hypothetical protein